MRGSFERARYTLRQLYVLQSSVRSAGDVRNSSYYVSLSPLFRLFVMSCPLLLLSFTLMVSSELSFSFFSRARLAIATSVLLLCGETVPYLLTHPTTSHSFHALDRAAPPPPRAPFVAYMSTQTYAITFPSHRLSNSTETTGFIYFFGTITVNPAVPTSIPTFGA